MGIANVALCTALVCLVTFGGRSNVGAPMKAVSGSMTRAMTPAPTFRSAVAQAYCEEVVDPANNMRYETMSYMPDFGDRDMENQVTYMIQNGLIPCIEFDTMNNGQIFCEHSRGPTYYDGRYWTMWKLPMFGATNARDVMAEVLSASAPTLTLSSVSLVSTTSSRFSAWASSFPSLSAIKSFNIRGPLFQS